MAHRETDLGNELDTLLDHQEWVRDVSRKLVRDSHGAEDLAQDAWVAALASRDEPVRSVRAWFSTVLRNRARERHRGEVRRSAREEGVARAEATPSTTELVEKVSVHQQVVRLAMALPEHYRETLLLRYFEGLTPSEIAAARGVPVSTVKTRLQRGLDLLRDELDHEHGGDGKAWMSALAPITGFDPAKVVLGAPLVPTLIPFAIAVLVTGAVLAAVFGWPGGGAGDEPFVDPGALAQADTPDAAFDALPASNEGTSVDEPAERVEEPPAEPAPALDFRMASAPLLGRVVRADGTPAPRVVVRFEPDWRVADGTPIAISGEDGTFELAGARGTGVVRAVAAGTVTVFAGLVGDDRSRPEPIVVVADAVSLGGTVTDEQGRTLAGARVQVRMPDDLRARLSERLAHSWLEPASDESDEAGRFELAAAPRVEDAVLEVALEGYETWRGAPPAVSDGNLHVTLVRPPAPEGALLGRVVDETGAPVAGARVSDGGHVTRSDADGAFWFLPTERTLRLTALSDGRLPAVAEPPWADEVVLRLGGAPKTITGRVVSPAGTPLRGVLVWVTDPTLFAHERDRDPNVKDRLSTRRAPEGLVRDTEVVESVLVGAPRSMWEPARTGKDGSFTIAGLLDRPYTLACLDPMTQERSDAGPFHPGEAGSEGVELVLDGALREVVRGRVVSEDGVPIAGVSIDVFAPVVRIRDGEEVVGTRLRVRRGSVSDVDGSFAILGVPLEGVALYLSGDGVLPVAHELVEPDGELLELTVPLRRDLQIAFDGPEPVDEIAVVDAAGEELPLHLVQGGLRQVLGRAPVRNGRTDVLSVSSAAASLVLYGDGVERRRAPVELLAGERTVVRP